MATISSSNLLALTDSLGLMYAALLAIDEGTEAGDIQDGAAANVTRILALTDIAQTADLANGFNVLNMKSATPHAEPSAIFLTVCQAIQKHVTNLNTFLTTNSAKVSQDFAALWRALFGTAAVLPANVYSEVVVARTVTITGATTDTEVAGTDLDPAVVAPVQYEVEVTTDIGSDTVVTLTMKKAAGTTETKVVNLTTAEDVGDKVDVGTGTDVYIGCTASAHTGGSTGVFKVQNKVPRTASL